MMPSSSRFRAGLSFLQLVFIPAVAVLGLPPSARAELSADQMVQKTADILKGQSSHGLMTMTVTTPKWTRELTIEGWTDGDNKSLIIIRGPQREKGTATLRYGAKLWTWMPRAERVLSIPPAMMHDSWMGSDFNYEDIVKVGSLPVDYTHKVVDKKAGSGFTTFTIECLPKESAAVVWGKVILVGDLYPGDVFRPSKEDYYDEHGVLVRSIRFSDYKKIDGREVPNQLECEPQAKEARRTVINYQKIEFNIDIPDDFFSLRQLQAQD